jgi:hypothetical protein
VVGNVYVSSNLTVDTDTLHVDSVNHSVGIETKTPDANLHVVGNTYVSSNLTVDTDTLHVDSVTHSVGVETKTPDANLHVVGNVYVSSNLTVDTDTLHVDSVSHSSVGIETKTPDANLHVVGNTYISSNLTVDTNTLHVDVGNKSVGLGTVTPSAELHVVGNVFVTSNVSIADTTATSSKTTGALKVGGGLGVAGDIHATNTYFEDATANSILVTDTTVTSSKTTGALRVSGGLGVVGDIHATNTYFEDATANSILVTDTTVTSSKTTGALIVTGGLGITGAIHGSAVNVEGVEADSLHVTDTTSTTSKTTGAVRLAGGLGVAGNIHATHVNFEDVVADSLTIEDTTLSTSKTTGAVIVAGGIGVTDNVYASRFVGDGGLLSNIATNLQSISENGNTTSNIIQFTGTETSFVSHSNVGIANTEPNHTLSVGTNFYVNEDGANTVVVDGNVSVSSNLTLGSNIAIVGLSVDKFPIVGSTKFLEDSIITKSGPDIVISGGLQVTGNIFQTGNVFVVDSNNTVIQDRILTLANNNTQTALDVGIIMEYPGHNIAIAHHGDESPERLSIGYTLNKHTDTQIDADSNTITLDVLGNLQVQNTFTVDSTLFHADSVTNRVGVLTATPAYTLDVHGNSNVAVARSKSSVVTDGTDSGSKITGAVTIIGGLGVGKNIHAKDVNFEAATLDSATIQNVTSTTNKTSGALIVGGGIGVAGNIHASNVNFEDAEIDSLTVTDGTPTNSKTSGAVKIAGGLGVVGAIYGSTVNFEGAEVDNLTVTATTISTSTGTGAVTIAGGLGVTGNVYAVQYHGDGSQLTGLVTTLEDVANNGNTMSNVIQFNNNQSLYDTSFVTTGKAGIKTANPTYDLEVTGNSYISSNVTVDTNTFHVDAVNNKVGVGTTEPEKTLHVQGDIKFNGTLFDTNGEFVTSPWVTTGTDIYYNVGNVGFGTNANVDANVHVNGNVYVTSNIHVGPDANQTSFLGRAAIGYNGTDDDHATFTHFDHNSATNYALKQTEDGVTHINTPTSQHIGFSVNNVEKARFTGGGDLKVGSNILYVDAADASVGLGTATPNSNLHVVGNAYVSSNLTVGNNVYVTGGLITNTGGVTKKTYSVSRTVTTGITPLVDINFTSNIFYAKITAQLIDGDEDLSTMILEVSGGRKSGETPTKNIAVGTKNIFGDQTNTNPWSPTVSTTGNKVTLTTSSALDAQDGYDIFIEYMSSNSNGGVVSVAESGTTIETFGY